MANSSIDICSQALTLLGEGTILSFDEDSDAAEICAQLYEDEVLSLLGAYPWRFARVRETLAKDGAFTPTNEWTYGYTLPVLNTTRVDHAVEVFNSAQAGARPVTAYEIQGTHILTDEETVIISYVKRVDEVLWPGWFVRLAAAAVAAKIALPITDKRSYAEHWERVAFGGPSDGGMGGLMAMAIKADSRGGPSHSLFDAGDPISATRFG